MALRLAAELRTAHRRICADPEVANATGRLDVERRLIAIVVEPTTSLAELSPSAQEALVTRLRRHASTAPGITTSNSLGEHVGGFFAGPP